MTGAELRERYQQFLREVPQRSLRHGDTGWRWFESATGPPTLVVLPGAVGGGNVYFLLAQELAPTIRVLALDLPMIATADEALGGLESVLDQAGVSSAYFLGASYSGLHWWGGTPLNPYPFLIEALRREGRSTR